ncbi:MAG: DUF4340 domain-containing protein [Fimbriiglobus sp.]|jgi:hypothetical protein|nr:DUF4340 domain-containing protein [Fimbriiglobus sp.]
MRWLIALILVVVIAGGVLLLVFAPAVRQAIGLSSPARATVVGINIDPAKVTRVEVSGRGQPLILVRDPAGRWTQPGDWPVREKEVNDLLSIVTRIQTRHLPVALGTDLGRFGLSDADRPHKVTLTADSTTTTLLFGQSGDGTAYVRVNDAAEVLRIAPDVLVVVSRPFDTYRRRQLFADVSRVKLFADGAIVVGATPLPGDGVTKVEVSGPDGAFTLTRTAPNPAPRRVLELPTAPPAVFVSQLANSWEVSTGTVRDRAEPGKLRAALSAVPELWVEGFPDPDAIGKVAAAFFTSTNLPLQPGGLLAAAHPDLEKDLVALHSGLTAERLAERRKKNPTDPMLEQFPKERRVAVTANGSTVVLRIGAVSRVEKGPEPEAPPPGQPPMPPPETKFYYARLENNPLVFEVRGDRFADLFAKPDNLRDPLVARFTPDEAQEVEITTPKPTQSIAGVVGGVGLSAFDNRPTVVRLTKKKGDPFAEREDDRSDRWKVGDQLAQTDKVNELLEALAKLEAKTADDRSDDGQLPAGFVRFDNFTVKVTAQARVVEGDTPPAPRTYTITLAGRDVAKKKVAVRMAGLPRVSLVDDGVVTLSERGPLAYRSRRLFDTAEMKLEKFTVAKPDGTAFGLESTPDRGQTNWKLTTPMTTDTDNPKASRLANDLSGLEAVEFVDEAPKADKLAGEYGLVQPRYTVDLGFGGKGAKTEKLFIGAARMGAEEVFARTSSGGVFTVPKSLVDSLDKGPLDLLPLQLWSTTADKVLAVTVARGKETYTVRKDDKKWRLSGPFDADASALDAEPLTAGVAAPKAERYDAVKADPIKHGLPPDQALRPAVVGGAAGDTTLSLTLTVKFRQRATDTDDDEVVTRTLLIGKPADGSSPASTLGQPPAGPGRYARFADGPNQAVFVLPESAFKPADRVALDWLDRELLSVDPGKLAKITIAGAETVTLTRDGKDNAWKADGFEVDKSLVGELVFNASNPPVVRLADYGPNVKWAEYGLDKPAVTVTLAMGGDNPETHTLKLGKELPSGERFLRVDDKLAVGVVSGAADAAISRGRLALADRSLLSFNPAEVLSVARKKGKDEFELASGTGWDVLKPTKFKADEETVLDALELLSRLRAAKVHSLDAKDLKPFGLDEPTELTVIVGIDKPKTLTLRVGKPVDDAKPTGDRFVQTDKAGPVKVLAAAAANKLLAEPVKFKDKLLGKFVDADRVTIARGDRTAEFAKVDGTWKMTKPVSTDAEQGDLDSLIAAAAKLRADELLTDKGADLKRYGLDTPAAMVKFFNGDKEVMAVLLGKKEDDGRRAFGKLAGGEAVALFDAGLTAKLLGEYRKRAVWSGVDASQVQSLAVSAGGSNFAFTKVGPAWVDPARADDQPDPAKVTDTLAVLAGLKAERFVADKDANPKLYGLDKPSRVIVVTLPGGNKTLQLGGEVGGTNGKQVYAKVEEKDRTDVFVLSEADTAKLTRDRAGYKK